MAPVATSFTLLLAVAGMVDAKPLLAPGRHAPPKLAGILANSKRSLHSVLVRYYGAEHGLTRPPALPAERDITLPAGWGYHGCVDESWNERLLQGFSFSSSTLTTLLCVNECGKQGYSIAGTQYGDECYCGNSYTGSGGAPTTDSACSKPCAGDPDNNCGNAWLLSLYTFNRTGLPDCVAASTTISIPGATASVNASVSATATLSSTVTVSASAGVSPSLTVSASKSAVSPGTTAPVHENAEDSSEWYALGCALDSGDRILNGYSSLNEMDLTIDGCLSTCEDKGFAFGGVEFGQECWCGNSVPSKITYVETQCDKPCTGNKSETCGGGYGLELFELISSGTDGCEADATTPGLTSGSLLVTGGIESSASSASSTTTNAATVIASLPSSSATTAAVTNPDVPFSDASHVVWAHHMVGNTYPYGQADWLKDINGANDVGIDGFALNIGRESWQVDRTADAYAAAQSSGTGFKLFLSLDMTSLSCSSWQDGAALTSLVTKYRNHPNQALHDGKPIVSTFAGSDCTFGTGSSGGWQSAFVDALGFEIFFVPSIFSDVSTFAYNSWMDGELNWNSGWPTSKSDLTTESDEEYMNALGDKEYMPAISPFFFTHFGQDSWNKNWLYRGDDWLYASRWEQVIAMRQNVKMTEILTWNDYGESSYIGPIADALPATSGDWVNGFDHTALHTLTKYYATAFKTGSYPTITEDKIIMWSRPHPFNANAHSDNVGKPNGYDWTDDNVYAIIMAPAASTVTLTSGSTSQTFSVSAGLTKLKIPSASGGMGGSIARDAKTVASYTSSGFEYTSSPAKYNYNYFVGSS